MIFTLNLEGMNIHNYISLVGGLEREWIMTFHILGIIIPTDELIFFRGVGIPPTSSLFWCEVP